MATSSASMVESARSRVPETWTMLVEVRLLRLFAVVPLGLGVDVDGKVAAVRALDGEGLGGGGGVDDAGDELIDVAAGIAGADGANVQSRIDVAGDLAAGDLDGFIEAEIQVDANGAGGGDDQGVGQGLGDGVGGEGGGHGLDGGRAGAGLQVADGGAGEDDLDLGVGAGRDVVHVEEGLQAVEAGEVHGGRAAEEGNGVVVGVDGVDGLNGGVKRDDTGQRGVGTDNKGRTGSGSRVRDGIAGGHAAAHQQEGGEEKGSGTEAKGGKGGADAGVGRHRVSRFPRIREAGSGMASRWRKIRAWTQGSARGKRENSDAARL